MFLIPLLLFGCAMGNPQRDYERWQREMEREESGKRTIWIDVDHPMVYLYGGAGPTQFSYSNRAGRDGSGSSWIL